MADLLVLKKEIAAGLRIFKALEAAEQAVDEVMNQQRLASELDASIKKLQKEIDQLVIDRETLKAENAELVTAGKATVKSAVDEAAKVAAEAKEAAERIRAKADGDRKAADEAVRKAEAKVEDLRAEGNEVAAAIQDAKVELADVEGRVEGMKKALAGSLAGLK